MSSRPHSRHTSAVSISSAVRSSSPSSSPSPVSPTSAGLSRRLSWNSNREDSLTVQDVQSSLVPPPANHALGPSSSWTNLVHLPTPDEHDLGSGWVTEPQTSRPFFHRFDSEVSLQSSSGDFDSSSTNLENTDSERLTTGPSHRRVASRSRKDYGDASLSPGPSRLAASVTRSPTFRAVSRTLRNASVRVVNIMGSDGDHRMVRLHDEDEEDLDRKDEIEMDRKTFSPPPISIPPPRPEPMPPEGGLRGRTLCFFTSRSRTRRIMDRLLRTS